MATAPDVKLADVKGLEDAKTALQQAVLVPMNYSFLFRSGPGGKSTQPWSGVLLYGPPGTGKTFIAKAIAGEAKAAFFSISPAAFAQKYVGEGEKVIKLLFEEARKKAPSIVFIDEVRGVRASCRMSTAAYAPPRPCSAPLSPPR